MKKDLEWLKDEVYKLFPSHDEMYDYPDDITVLRTEMLSSVIDLIDQLDEPEVLSQELPVIPNYVVKWISVHHERFDLYPALKRLENNALSWEDVYEWYRRNTHTFVNAYLTGKYEVEKEQKYHVEDGKHTLLCKWESSDGWKVISTIESTEDDLPIEVLDFGLTEQEIKDYDERFWPFAIKVEELEE